MILEASFLIDLIADDDGATAKLCEIDDKRVTVPTLAYTEVGVGIESGTPQAQRFEAVRRSCPSFRTTTRPHDVPWTCNASCARTGSRSVRLTS